MGIYIGLDIVPNYIDQDDWEKVFDETLELIRSYPFATLTTEDINGFKRLILDQTVVQSVFNYHEKERYWKINGDLDSKKQERVFRCFPVLTDIAG
ncbi:hypothetical protein [Heyndrickxia ginsengihumi]|uniref:hypothetical protein n=1 Tax=Heyndrickxia ginsengihumi TaxID=363870 RepID=UPI0004718EDF|nr:hypothetical protein [Heyndrickxia ginsengihumi]